MIGLALFSSIYSTSGSMINEISKRCSLDHIITDETVSAVASEISGIPQARIKRAFSSKTSVFNSFTHEKECYVAFLKKAVSTLIDDRRFMIFGYTALLASRKIPHIFSVGLHDTFENRILSALKSESIPEESVQEIIRIEDMNCNAWSNFLFSKETPWHSDLFDTVIDSSAIQQEDPLNHIIGKFIQFENNFTQTNEDLSDFKLAADINVALAQEGHNVKVEVHSGIAYLAISHQILMMSRLKDELSSIVRSIPGTDQLDIEILQNGEPSVMYKKRNKKMPAKLLLVDDEIEFVQTLSERLQMRDIGSVVAHDGESALELVRNDDPEVMIVDLKMPGMDGMTVLREVKKIRPEIEVIVLTGHGSEQDKIQCLELGAFDYMQKPVDIEILNSALQKAYEKIQLGG